MPQKTNIYLHNRLFRQKGKKKAFYLSGLAGDERETKVKTCREKCFSCIVENPRVLFFPVFLDLSIINFVTVAYSADEVIYVWQLPKKKAVDYEGKLQLSQFDIMETAFRGLNYSRGNNSKCINFALEKKNLFKMSFFMSF